MQMSFYRLINQELSESKRDLQRLEESFIESSPMSYVFKAKIDAVKGYIQHLDNLICYIESGVYNRPLDHQLHNWINHSLSSAGTDLRTAQFKLDYVDSQDYKTIKLLHEVIEESQYIIDVLMYYIYSCNYP